MPVLEIDTPPDPYCGDCGMRHPVCAACSLDIAYTEHNRETCECERLPL